MTWLQGGISVTAGCLWLFQYIMSAFLPFRFSDMANGGVSPTLTTDYVKSKFAVDSSSLNGQPSSGYSSGDYSEHELKFKGNVDRWRCPICHRVVRHPVQTTCGHRFCDGCLFEYLPADGTAVRCPANEEDCNMISRDESNRTVGKTRRHFSRMPTVRFPVGPKGWG